MVENSPINNYSVVHFVNESQGIVINNIFQLVQSGGEWMEVLVSFEVFETVDGGENWSLNTVDPTCGFDGPSFDLNPAFFYIIGEKFSKFELK